jgi:hypothetical protein
LNYENDLRKQDIADLLPPGLVSKCTTPQYPRIKRVNWRVDVSISTSSLSKTMEPCVLVQLNLTDDRLVCFEIALVNFHVLRFNVALVLKEMDDLLNRQIFRLID